MKKVNFGGYAPKIILILIFALLFSQVNVKVIRKQVSAETEVYEEISDKLEYVYLGGELIKLSYQLDSYIVLDGKNALNSGDYITSINNEAISSNTGYKSYLNTVNTSDVLVTYIRDNTTYQESINTNTLRNMDIRSSFSANATVTYVNPDTNLFTGISHNLINNVNLSGDIGSVSNAKVISVEKSTANQVGKYNTEKLNTIGSINVLNQYGTVGYMSNNYTNDDLVILGNDNDIHLGDALIYSTNSQNEKCAYKIKITNVDLTKAEMQITFKIEDDRLKDDTNGIIKGMSGSPIVQNGILVGSVSHAINGMNNYAYGLSIESTINNTK